MQVGTLVVDLVLYLTIVVGLPGNSERKIRYKGKRRTSEDNGQELETYLPQYVICQKYKTKKK